MKVKVKISDALKFKEAKKKNVFYTVGYLVRDCRDGWNYVVDFPELLSSRQNYETIRDLYWEKDSDIENIKAA